jgi:transcriptional regulator with PAS, ATPase and Fis domain
MIRRHERKSKLMLRIEEEQGRPLEVVLRERHRALGNYTKVADELGVPSPTVYYWFRKFDIPLSQYTIPGDVPSEVPA